MTDSATSTTTVAAENNSPAEVQTTIFCEEDQIIDSLLAEHQAKISSDLTEDTKEDGEAPEKTGAEATSEKTKDQPYKGPSYKSGEEAVTSILKAFESGDPEALSKATGKPKSFFQVSDAKWADFRKKEDGLRTREKTLTQREANFKKGQEMANKEYGDAIRAAAAYQEGDYESFVTLVQGLTGESYDEAQRKVIKGEIALAPELKEERRKRREAEKRLAEIEEQKNQPAVETQAQTYDRLKKQLESELAGHGVAKVKGFADLVLNKIRESYSKEDKTFTLTAEEAAEKVLEDKIEEAKSLGLQPAAKPAKPAPKVAPTGVSRTRAAEARSPDGVEYDDDDDAIIEDLKRQHALSKRK